MSQFPQFGAQFPGVPDMFDFSKNMEAFQKFYPDMGAASAPFKAVTDMAAKYREVTIEVLNKNVELTTAWMKDAAKDATTLMTSDQQPQAVAKKAGEIATAAFQDLPSRLFAYAEVAKKAQADLLDTVIAATPKVVEEAKTAAKTVAKKVA